MYNPKFHSFNKKNDNWQCLTLHRRLIQDDRNLKACVGYRWDSKLCWATLQDHVSTCESNKRTCSVGEHLPSILKTYVQPKVGEQLTKEWLNPFLRVLIFKRLDTWYVLTIDSFCKFIKCRFRYSVEPFPVLLVWIGWLLCIPWISVALTISYLGPQEDKGLPSFSFLLSLLLRST